MKRRPAPRAANRVRRLIVWTLLALPAALMLKDWLDGDALAMDLLEPTGDMAVRLLVLALLPGPLADFFRASRLLRAWLSIRRNLGVAAFLYAVLHLLIYAVDLGMLAAMFDELTLPGIWTGWLALALLVPAAATSSNAAMKSLGRRWTQLQYVVYPALLLTFIHWLLLEWSWQKAAVHGVPLLLAWTLRALRRWQKFKGVPHETLQT